MNPAERAKAVIKTVRDDEIFNLPSDARWERAIAAAIEAELADKVPIADFLELYDAAHAVIDHIGVLVDHAVYDGGTNAVEDFREIAAALRRRHDEKVPDPLGDALDPDSDDIAELRR